MKIRITLKVSDALRHHIGKQSAPTERLPSGMAKRSAVVAWLEKRLVEGEEAWRKELPALEPQLNALEKREYAQAVEYLRALGRSDEQIEDFLMVERARYKFPLRQKARPV